MRALTAAGHRGVETATSATGDMLSLALRGVDDANRFVARTTPHLRSERPFLHSPHNSLQYGSDSVLVLYRDDAEMDEESGGARADLLLPPLSLPRSVRRARDCSFQAVTREKDALGTALIFVPELNEDDARCEWSFDRLLGIIAGVPRITFVLLCRSATQRALADRLNCELTSNENLRIIDVSVPQGPSDSTLN